MILGSQHKHILKLIERDRDADGWATVSESVFSIVANKIPAELATFEKKDIGGRARLTDDGQNVLDAMKWLGG